MRLFILFLLCDITSWGLTFSSNFDSLLAIQNKFLKIINFINQYDSPHPSYSTSKILKGNDLHKLQLASFVYESYMQQNPQEFHSYFTDVAKVHCCSTCQASDKDQFIPRKNTTQYGLYSVTTDIRNKPSVYSFHKNLKQHYINLYQ